MGRNWSQIFVRVPDIRAGVPRDVVDGRTLWTEWEMSGTQSDGTSFLMRGVVVFEIDGRMIASARFYLEPVEESGGDIDTATRTVSPARPN